MRACVACALTASQAVSWSVALSVERPPLRPSLDGDAVLLLIRDVFSSGGERGTKGEKSKCVSDGLRRSFDGGTG